MLCSSHVKIWNVSNHVKKPNKPIGEKLKTNGYVLLFIYIMWLGIFQILICEPQSIWHKLLALSWLYLHIYIFLLFVYRTYFCAHDLFMCNNWFYRTCFDGSLGSFMGGSFIRGLSSGGSFIIFSIKLSQSNIISNDFFTGGSSRVLHRGSFIGGPSSIFR